MSEEIKPKPILDDSFWEGRLRRAEEMGELHRTVFECSHGQYLLWHEAHRRILEERLPKYLKGDILDIGCGYGRILDILPEGWDAKYVGIDLSPTLLDKAVKLHRKAIDQGWVTFLHADARRLKLFYDKHRFAFGITASMERMITANCGPDFWAEIKEAINYCCVEHINLEYEEWIEHRPSVTG